MLPEVLECLESGSRSERGVCRRRRPAQAWAALSLIGIPPRLYRTKAVAMPDLMRDLMRALMPDPMRRSSGT